MAGPAMTSLLPRSLTILSPSVATLSVKVPWLVDIHFLTEIKSQN